MMGGSGGELGGGMDGVSVSPHGSAFRVLSAT